MTTEITTQPAEAPDRSPQEIVVVQQPQKHLIQLWYHGSDVKLLETINPYTSHMYRRLGASVSGFTLGYRETQPSAPTYDPTKHRFDTDGYFLREYEAAKAKYERGEQDYQQKHDGAISALQQTVLFVPCVSPEFLKAFECDVERNPELAKSLETPGFQIMPIVVRPVETGEAYQFRPLCTYEGHALETACKELVAVMETVVRTALGLPPQKTSIDLLFHSPMTVQATIPSQRTTADLVLEMLQPVRELVAQASTQVAEARQLVITERSQAQPRGLARWFSRKH